MSTQFFGIVTEFGEVGTQSLPLIPESTTTNSNGSQTWAFLTNGIAICEGAGCWVDPPAATGFTYSMTNSALFTGIADFPAGFGDAIDVSVAGSSLGTFGPGNSVDFTTFPGGGVAKFVVSGITPAISLSSAEAFPLKIVFDSADAEFTMTSTPAATPVPAVSEWGLIVLGGTLMAMGAFAAVRRETASSA